MTGKLLILIITSLVMSTINGQADDDFMDSDAIEKTPEPEGSGLAQPTEESAANDGSTQETSEKSPNIADTSSTESSPPAQEVTTQSNIRTTVIDGQVYALVPAPNPFPNLGPPPFYLRPQPPQYPPQPPHYPPQVPHYPPQLHHYSPQPISHPYHPQMPFMPMPYPMMFPPPMPPMHKPGDMPPPMLKPGDAPNPPGSQVILLNQKNPGDAVVGQSTVYLKPDGNREIIIIK